MKYLLFLLLPLQSIGQYNNLKIEKQQVTFEKVYVLDTIQAPQVKRLLIAELPKINGFKDMQVSEEIITAKLSGHEIDYKRTGNKTISTPGVLNFPLFGDVSIFWKDNKYRVLITNLYLMTSMGKFTADDMLIKKGQWSQNKNSQKIGIILDGDLDYSFTVESKKDW